VESHWRHAVIITVTLKTRNLQLGPATALTQREMPGRHGQTERENKARQAGPQPLMRLQRHHLSYGAMSPSNNCSFSGGSICKTMRQLNAFTQQMVPT